MPIAEVKAHFSEVLRLVEEGDEIIVTRGARKEQVAVVIPLAKYRVLKERRLGSLKGRMSVEFLDDWNMTDEELLAS